MGKLQLKQSELELLRDPKKILVPDGKIKIVKEKTRIVLIVDILKLFNTSIVSKLDFLEFIEQFESIGWTYYTGCQQYIYFTKKISLFKRIKSKFNRQN